MEQSRNLSSRRTMTGSSPQHQRLAEKALSHSPPGLRAWNHVTQLLIEPLADFGTIPQVHEHVLRNAPRGNPPISGELRAAEGARGCEDRAEPELSFFDCRPLRRPQTLTELEWRGKILYRPLAYEARRLEWK